MKFDFLTDKWLFMMCRAMLSTFYINKMKFPKNGLPVL